MPVDIRGKQYFQVHERLEMFWSDHPDWSIETEIAHIDGDDCVIKTLIKDAEGRVRATGFAHEVRGSSNINNTSHWENCETSSIGRCLSCLNYSGGGSYASAEEVANAIKQQQVSEATEALRGLIRALMLHHEEVMAIKAGISACDEHGLQAASRAWYSMPDDIKQALWIAESKGGVFSAGERQTMQTKEFREAYYGGDE